MMHVAPPWPRGSEWFREWFREWFGAGWPCAKLRHCQVMRRDGERQVPEGLTKFFL